MTTIAYDGTLIAADGLEVNAQGVITQTDTLKVDFIEEQGRRLIYAGAGSCASIERFVRWHSLGQVGDPPTSHEDFGFACLVLEYSKAPLVFSDRMPFVGSVYRAPVAIGEGDLFAEGVMAHGGTALDAVKLAADRFIRTGGRIRCYHVGEFFERGRVVGVD